MAGVNLIFVGLRFRDFSVQGRSKLDYCQSVKILLRVGTIPNTSRQFSMSYIFGKRDLKRGCNHRIGVMAPSDRMASQGRNSHSPPSVFYFA